ncbi:MAG: PorP/SprF family type IX secretion system membrane protein, partial [Saprospiraceae bacterium]|nr:PorP/SprF family type IX secretion system membrane protein [Saprospiraceae bacterium]
MIRSFLLYGLMLLFALPPSRGQDPVFSQFYAAPLQINPAFAGITFAPRITLNYRNQWPSWPNAYITYAATFETSVDELNSGFGLRLMADNAGDGIYRTNRLAAIYGYQVQAGEDLFFKFGLEAGVIQTRLDWDRLIFEDQIDPINGLPIPGNGNGLSRENPPEDLDHTVVDISAGMLVYGQNFYGGISLKHLNRPAGNFFEINNNLGGGLPLRTTLHGGAEFTIDKGNNRNGPTFISPNLMLIRQGDFGQINAGAYAGSGLFFGGMWFRYAFNNADALIGLVGLRYDVFRIGYSYDATISTLSLGRTGGTHEISLTINF